MDREQETRGACGWACVLSIVLLWGTMVAAGGSSESRLRSSFASTRALFQAIGEGDQQRVEELIGRGADVNQTYRFSTPLSVAAASGHRDIVAFLLGRGADANGGGALRSGPLHGASAEGYVEIARLLVDHGAHPEAVDWWGRTPLHRAAVMAAEARLRELERAYRAEEAAGLLREQEHAVARIGGSKGT